MKINLTEVNVKKVEHMAEYYTKIGITDVTLEDVAELMIHEAYRKWMKTVPEFREFVNEREGKKQIDVREFIEKLTTKCEKIEIKNPFGANEGAL